MKTGQVTALNKRLETEFIAREAELARIEKEMETARQAAEEAQQKATSLETANQELEDELTSVPPLPCPFLSSPSRLCPFLSCPFLGCRDLFSPRRAMVVRADHSLTICRPRM